MAWEEQLFAVLDDLEQQAEALYDTERALELADRSRAAYQQVPLAARLMASLDHAVTLEVSGVGTVAGVLERMGTDWCLVGGHGQDWVLRLGAVLAVEGTSDRAVPEVAWSPLTRLGLGSALRRLAEAGERVVLHRVDGIRHDGVIRRVGQDFVEVRERGSRSTLVPFTAVAAAQSRD